MANFFSDLTDMITSQQATPTQTIIPYDQLLSQAGGFLPQIANSSLAYNDISGTGLTNQGLGYEQLITPGNAALRNSVTNRLQSNLDLGYRLPPELQDLVTTNALQQLGSSGAGASDLGKLFGARSIAGAGLDFQNQNLQNAFNGSRYNPGNYQARDPFGLTPGSDAMSGISQIQAAQDNYANLKEDIRRQNFSALINTGGRIIGTVVGGIYGGEAGAKMGGAIGGNVLGGSRVAGQQNSQGQQGGGINGGGFLSSIFGGMGGGGMGQYSAGAGQQYAGANGNVMTSTMASPVAMPY